MRKFRLLNADEIDCRIGTCSEKGLSLLLYKDARCDMNILDETVGQMNWQRRHSRDNANCIVSIWDDEKKQWVEKEDVGTESNTEAEKGLASDSFKRACVNWGIGRELYTAPFIWVGADKCEIKKFTTNGKDRYTCNDRFTVKEITYNDKNEIASLEITKKNGETVFSTRTKSAPKPKADPKPAAKAEQKPYPKPELFLCENCGHPIVDYDFTDSNGKTSKFTAAKHVAMSRKKYDNHVFCIDCIRNGEV